MDGRLACVPDADGVTFVKGFAGHPDGAFDKKDEQAFVGGVKGELCILVDPAMFLSFLA
jgi:hypothetical protein